MTYEIAFTIHKKDNENKNKNKNKNKNEEILESLITKIRGDFRDKYIISSSINGNHHIPGVYENIRRGTILSTCYYYLYNYNNDDYSGSDAFLLYL